MPAESPGSKRTADEGAYLPPYSEANAAEGDRSPGAEPPMPPGANPFQDMHLGSDFFRFSGLLADVRRRLLYEAAGQDPGNTVPLPVPVLLSEAAPLHAAFVEQFLPEEPLDLGLFTAEELRRLARVVFDAGQDLMRQLRDQLISAERPVTIYLTDEHGHQQVQRAVEEFVLLAGGKVVGREHPRWGSWFRRMTARFGDVAGSPAAREAVRTGVHALDTRFVHAADAAVTSELMQHLAPLIQALEATEEAVVRAGALLVVKAGGRLIVHQLTPTQQLLLDHQPDLASAPREILAALQLSDGRDEVAVDAGQHQPGDGGSQ